MHLCTYVNKERDGECAFFWVVIEFIIRGKARVEENRYKWVSMKSSFWCVNRSLLDLPSTTFMFTPATERKGQIISMKTQVVTLPCLFSALCARVGGDVSMSCSWQGRVRIVFKVDGQEYFRVF